MNPKRILLVEDEVLIARFLEDVLTGAGHDAVGPARA
jgi:DNA-binding response OmpR family regulator